MTEYQGVLIIGESVNGNITSVTKELLSLGQKVGKDLGQPLSCLFLNNGVTEAPKEAILLGSDICYLIKGPSSDQLHPDYCAEAFTAAIKQLNPSIIILGHTDFGRDVAPRLAARLECPVTLDCIKLSIDPDTRSLIQARNVYGGKAIATWNSDYKPQVMTIKAGATPAAVGNPSHNGEVKNLDIQVDESKIKGKLLNTVIEPVKGVALEEAKAIVAGGAAIGGSQGFKMLEELAQLLGGTVGATRVPCDEGWVPFSLEIGQTGHIVHPDLYIAIGISGATQHIVGCSDSKCIVAINRDPDAPIFKMADFGIVGKFQEVVPALIERLKTLSAK